MLTRLIVNGFKNLVGVDVRFGPFTCIAGRNGVGKSNLFDAIRFLSALADRSFMDAALSVRDENGKSGDIRGLFHRMGDRYDDEMSFIAEMIVPKHGEDDLGQEAQASVTFLRYSLTLGYRQEENRLSPGSIELLKEELRHVTVGDTPKELLFPYAQEWLKSAVEGIRRGGPLISTDEEGEPRVVKVHQDQTHGRPLSRSAANLRRTVLSAANAGESPTALLARREMQSWRLLQLEPTSLRTPDSFSSPAALGMDGSHLPRTLYRLAHTHVHNHPELAEDEAEGQVYGRVANRLLSLIDDVRGITVNRDEQRELYTLVVTDRDRTSYPARALSDGTLRFLALTALELDPEAQGLICLEEPENGIHPERIGAMLKLLQDIASDTTEEVTSENPLRQVIINTHSPAVVAQIPPDSLLFAEAKELVQTHRRFRRAVFSCLPGTWRHTKAPEPDRIKTIPLAKVIQYLSRPMDFPEDQNDAGAASAEAGKPIRRVIDRPDVKQYLLPL